MAAHAKASFAKRFAIALVVSATLYTAALCFLHTNGLRVSNTLVAIVDGTILLTALAYVSYGASRWLHMLLLALAANFLLITLLSGNLELKAVRDPLVPITFAALGLRLARFDVSLKAFFLISAIVIAFAIFEFVAPAAYVSLFNVLDFYVARGVVDAETVQRLDGGFFVSGSRDDARMILPFLGEHRVSSVFLEPVSMGNFGAIAIALALSFDAQHRRTAIAVGAVGLFAIAIADARFGSIVALLFVAGRLLPAAWTRVGLPLLPLIALGVLVAFAVSGVGSGDDLPTRLAGSGRTLLEMSPASVFGLADYEVGTIDAGYAYMLSAFGLPFCVVLWVAFVLLPTPTRQAERYKLMMAIYICTLLCVSGTSLFAMKTGALAFFIAGALAAPALVTTRRWRTAVLAAA